MMFSMEKCSGRSGTATSEESELYAGGGEGMGKEGVASDEVASAVAAVSDEIGDILKDELGDADRADRIGAELADLSAELGLLAGLADGEAQPDFASRFEVPFEWIAMGHRGSGSGSSSSSWSGARGGRARRPSRLQRVPRRRPIAKGKEMSRRRSLAARRVVSVRARRAEVVSDASDVGADSDSDDQWTELDDACSSDGSSVKEAAVVDVDCNGFQHKGLVEAPAMGQFLLPLLSSEPTGAEPEHLFIRHEDILQLLASAEESVREDVPLEEVALVDDTQPDMLPSEPFPCDDTPISPEDEAALLHYVCEAEAQSGAQAVFSSVEEWLLGVYHSWCEISALMYTLIGTNMSVEMVTEQWVYRARFGCHCRACLCLADSAPALAALLGTVVTNLARDGSREAAARVVRALKLRSADACDHNDWDIQRLMRVPFTDEDAGIIHEQLTRAAAQSEIANQIINSICLCRTYDHPMEKQHAVERFCKILENFKAASTITFKVEMIPVGAGGRWVAACARRLQRYLAPHQRNTTADRLRDMRARTTPVDLSAWSGYKHRCDCLTPRTLCAQQRKQLLRISFFGMMQAVNEYNGAKPADDDQLQQGDGTGAKPPDSEGQPAETNAELSESNATADLDDNSDANSVSGTGSLGLSTSSSLDSASELLLAAAAAVESGGSEGEAAPGELCRTVRHLMRSIASIERLMDRVLKHCDEWPAPSNRNDHEARKRVDMGLSEVDRKLMAMYRRLPEVHRRQLQVYRKQKKLSTVCMQLVGGQAPAPPPPGSPPPAAPQPARALCPQYHLQRFREVRRKVMHMRDQQLYYHRLRMWLEDQLRQERESLPDSNVTLIEDLPRRKRRTASPKLPRLTTAPKRKLKPASPISKPHKILQLLKHKAPAQTTELLTQIKDLDDTFKSEVEPPEAFPLVEKEDNVSDTETIVGEKDDLCKEMKECLAKFANFALNSPENEEYQTEVKYPESVSPPLQEMSPTTSEPMPVYTPKPSQRLLAVNKFLNRNNLDCKHNVIDFQSQAELNVPLNARRTPILVKEETDKELNLDEHNPELVVDTSKEPNIYKYVTFGIEIKKAMEECQNIINSYNSIKDKGEEKDGDNDGPLSLEQICEVMMSLDTNSIEFLEKMDSEEPIELTTANAKLAELVENMPQILANMPEIASKLSEFANASFELPEFASIMNSIPEVNNEAQLTPETLKQIRELKLNKARDNVKVTKHTAKRKTTRRIKNNIDTNDIIGTMTFELDSKDISELLKDEKELQALMKNKSNNKEDFKDLLFSISAQVVINKVFEYLKQNKSPELAKFIREDNDLFSLPKNSINSEMYSKASTLFDNSVKDALSMDELRELVKSRFNSWKHYVATKFKSIPIELLENEIEAMLDKFYSYIQDLAGKQCINDSDKIIEKIDELRNNKDSKDSDSESYTAPKESLNQITKLLSTSAGNTFDLLIMKLSKMSQDKKTSVKSLKFKYMDVIRRCAESQQLAGWILLDPEIAANVIQELTGLPIKKTENLPDFATMSNDRKRDFFIEKLREMNRLYMETLPKKVLTGDEWLVMLYRLEQLEEKLKEAFSKVSPPPKPSQTNASEAEILAAKGLSKIIGKANVRIVKKAEPPKPKEPEKESIEPEKDDKKCKNDALLAKCEAILTSKGENSLLESFYTIKSYITQGLPVPETYKKHVISICSSIDAKLLEEDIEDTLRVKDENEDTECEKTSLSVIGSQNPELLAKYSAQALRNAKQTLNAVAFRNMMRNGQSKSESDACDTPKSDCKWTNDCICSTCKDTDNNSVCLGDIVKQCYDMEAKSKSGLEEKRKEVKAKPVVKPAKPAKCEVASHLPHICKVGHSANGNNACAGDASADQPCTCCYCTVFGHAPPLTTPVPRNFNETRERLRSILNKKKQKCKTANGEQVVPETKPTPVVQPQPVETTLQQQQPPKQQQQLPKQPSPPVVQPKPPALPKSLPPTLTAVQTQAQQRRQAIDYQQKQLAEKMAKMVVTEKPDNKPKALQRTVPIQVNVPPTLKAEGKVNPNAMEQIRLQQLKQQQQAQLQQQQLQQQQLQQQAQQQAAQQAAQQAQQKKPEPIYDLPIHNKPTLTPQQQQQIRQQQLLQQQQQQLQQQRQSRPQQQRAMSLSSRDTSVFSTSSGCDGDSCWRGSRAEDPRDLDALLQYIEGPARHVDKGKKRAKKQRQKAKKLESRLIEERAQLATELLETRRSLETLCGAHASARRRVDELRRALAHHHRAKKKPSGKKQKLSPTQQAKVQEMAEQLGELTTLLNNAAKEVQESEKQVNDCSRRLQHCERELSEARAMQGKSDRSSMEQAAMLHKHQQLQQQQHQQLQQQQQLQHEQQLHLQMLEMEKQKLERQKQAALVNSAAGSNAGIVRVRRMPGDGAVTVSVPGRDDTPLAHLLTNNRHLTVLNVCEEPQPKPQAEKKQTWEQALAHMNQLAKGSAKEKKKKEQPKPEPKKEPQRSQSLPDATQPLSKKQRKLLAKQQAEEEEKKKQAQEAKAKRQEAKKEPAKPEPASKKDKKESKKVEPPALKKKEEKKENKKEKTEKKGKENKQEKNAPAPAAKAKQQQQPAQQPSKKEKKKEQQKPQVINITPDTTIEVVNKKNAHTNELDKPASCSIMEQLSCGVQVADLRLPPGITLTRVQPTEQKERPTIKSVPLWKSSQLPAAPTPVARPPPVINADPNMMMFTTALPEAPKTIINAEPPPPPPAAKSKKAKKKAKKAAAAAETDPKTDGTKMVTLRNPMFHPNLPPVQVSSTQAPKKPEQIRIPDPIPMPPNACQATITPTSNGMYTIRNPLMSMMHQQTMMGMRNPSPQLNPMFGQPQYNYVNPNVYNPVPNVPPQTYVLDPRASPKDTEFQNRIMNLASFTQKNDEGYSLFKTSEDNQQRNFLTPEFYDDPSPKPIVSPNPIGTRPNNDSNRSFDSDSSLFANPIQRPEPIGTPLKRDESDFGSLYTPFGQEDRNVFRNALFNDKNESVKMEEMGGSNIANGDPLPYFQRLRVGSKLNNEVTIHHVTESKFYKGQEPPQEAARAEESLFSGAAPPGGAGAGGAWSDGLYTHVSPASVNNKTAALSGRSSPTGSSLCSSGGSSPPTDDAGFGAVGTRAQPAQESSVFLPDRSITNLSTLEVSEREIESFKRFDFYFEPPQHKPKVQLDVRDIAAALRHNHK